MNLNLASSFDNCFRESIPIQGYPQDHVMSESKVSIGIKVEMCSVTKSVYSVLTGVEMYQLRLVAVIPSINLSSLLSKIRSEKEKTCLIFFTKKFVDNVLTPLNRTV